MTHNLIRLLAVGSVLVASGPALAAQDRPESGGFWMTLGLGVGPGGSSGTYTGLGSASNGGVDIGSHSVLGAQVEAGGTVSHRIRLGGAVGASRSNTTGSMTANVGVTMSYHLSPATTPGGPGGLFLELSPAISYYHGGRTSTFLDYCLLVSPDCTYSPIVPGVGAGWGWGFTVGVGHEYGVSRHVSLAPVARYVFSGIGDLTSWGPVVPYLTGSGITALTGSSVVARGWTQSVFELGLEVTYR